MNVVFIGSGNVATVLGSITINAGHNIVQVISKQIENATLLATALKAQATNDISEIVSDADIYIIAVSDNSISSIAENLHLNDKVVVHTSGAASIELLKNSSDNYGILYPLQSIRKEKLHIPVMPFLIDAVNEETLNVIRSFASTLTDQIFTANDEQRLKLHTAAIVSSNFTNHLYALTEAFCEKEKVPFKMLIPLIQETALRLDDFSAKDVQTGPAIRNDVGTIHKHLGVLENHPSLHKLYEELTKSIIRMYHK